MPHPDAYLYPFHHPHWRRRAANGEPDGEGEGVAIFRNGVDAATARL
jgi:phosphoribosylformylglycinamidine synthase